jgi:hypothetical protein
VLQDVDTLIYDVSAWVPPALNYYGFSVVPVWDPDYAEWGFWVGGIWIPLAGQPGAYGY